MRRVTASKEQLLFDFEDLLSHFPSDARLSQNEVDNAEWHGKLRAAIRAWRPASIIEVDAILRETSNLFTIPSITQVHAASVRLKIILHEARHTLKYELGDTRSLIFQKGEVYSYFEGVRKALALASSDVFFVDPYMNADFVARYLPLVPDHVQIRLLTEREPKKTLSATQLFSTQRGGLVSLRCVEFHDRYLFVDGQVGFQSGASFKDGAKNDPTSLTEVRDVLHATLQQYESLWQTADVLL